MPSNKRYDQYCAIARGLDVVGDRWTLLIVRELLTGPKRYGELADGLPGIATNLLADRLRTLENAEVVARESGAGTARSRPYELTSWGRQLQPVLLALADWALPLLGAPGPADTYRLRWLVLTLQSQFDPSAAKGLRRTYEFRIGDETVHAEVHDGRVDPADGPADDPDVAVVGTTDAFLAWGTGRHTSARAVDGGLQVLGPGGDAHDDAAGALDGILALFTTGP